MCSDLMTKFIKDNSFVSIKTCIDDYGCTILDENNKPVYREEYQQVYSAKPEEIILDELSDDELQQLVTEATTSPETFKNIISVLEYNQQRRADFEREKTPAQNLDEFLDIYYKLEPETTPDDAIVDVYRPKHRKLFIDFELKNTYDINQIRQLLEAAFARQQYEPAKYYHPWKLLDLTFKKMAGL